jgi:transcription termination/antitermination protein NusG
VSDEANKLADEIATASDSLPAEDQAAPPTDNGRAEPLASAPAAPDLEADDDDASEVVPVERKPLSRPALHGSPEEKAKKKADEGPLDFNWYILKVQSNRERSIADALKRKVRVEGLEDYFAKTPDGDIQIIVPTEKVTEFKGGKKKVVERKLYPGYIVVHMVVNEDTWFLVRETPGVGDFTGAGGKPTPMLPHEVARIVQTEEEESDEAPKLDIKFKVGDRMKVKDGTFEGFEGEVGAIDPQSGKISVMINIFGRSTPVELEYWQVENV